MRQSCGCDLVYIPRLEQRLKAHEGRLAERILDAEELRLCGGRAASAAGFFAAKEAVAKAIGCGIWGADGLGFEDIRIRKDRLGAPRVILSEKAQAKLSPENSRERVSVSLSISHDGDYAMAFCTILCSEA